MFVSFSLQEKPKVYLTPNNMVDPKYSDTKPILCAGDIQHLLLFAIQGNVSSYKPRCVGENFTSQFVCGRQHAIDPNNSSNPPRNVLSVALFFWWIF